MLYENSNDVVFVVVVVASLFYVHGKRCCTRIVTKLYENSNDVVRE